MSEDIIKKMTETVEKMGSANSDFREAMEAKIKALEEKGHVPADLQEKLEKQSNAIGSLEDDLMSLKAKSENSEAAKEESNIEQKSLWNKYIRGGEKALSAEESQKFYDFNRQHNQKAMFTASGADGGFTVRPQFSNQITESVKESSPIRQIADVMTIGTKEWVDLYDESDVGFGWVGERESRTETTTGSIDEIIIPANEMYAEPSIYSNTLEDSEINLENYLQGKVASKFARAEGTAFVSGNDPKQPKGFNSYAAGSGFNMLEDITTDGSGVIAFPDLIEIVDSLLDPYKSNATWVMNKETRSAIRQLVDSDLRPLWEPNVQAGQPALLLGYRVVAAVDMPAISAGNLSVAFGDFRQGYKIVDRSGIKILRDNITEKGKILYYTTRRVGGGVQDFQAIKRLKIKA